MLRLIIIAMLCLTGCAVFDYPTVKDPGCATGVRYTSGPHKDHCKLP